MVEKFSSGPDRPGPVGRAPRPTTVDVPPLDVHGVRTVQVGTALWGVALVALLPFWTLLEDAGNLWWIWTCSAGLGTGLLGVEYCKRRRDRGPDDTSPAPQPAPRGGRRRA